MSDTVHHFTLLNAVGLNSITAFKERILIVIAIATDAIIH